MERISIMHFSFIPSFPSQVRRLALIALPFLIAFSAATMNTNALPVAYSPPPAPAFHCPRK
jgi:hypothetical protein